MKRDQVEVDRTQFQQALLTPRRPSEYLIEGSLFVCALVSVLTTVGIVLTLAVETIRFFDVVSFAQFFGDTEWTPLFHEKHFGVWPLLGGTLLTTAIAIAVAVPFGLLAAIYLSEYASEKVRKILKPALEILAGVPTVVYGYFALMFVTPVLQTFVPNLSGFNALSPGIVMGIMIVPIVASLSEDAIYSVPRSLREGGWALGGRKLPTIMRIVVPSAFSGVAAAVLLGLSRAIGETMIVTIAAGMQPRLTIDPRVPIETMTAFIVQVSLGDTPAGSLEYKTIFAVGTTLFIMTLILNLISFALRRKIVKRS